MFYLVGLGVKGDLTLEGLSHLKKCDKIYVEFYTNILKTPISELERKVGKEIVLLKREEVEGSLDFLREASIKNMNIALLVVGDPLVATTHTDILLQARKLGIEFKVIHNSSILTAVGETGLQLYKFGRATSIPYPDEDYKPTSFYEVICENRKRGLHTLIFLDIKEDENRYMNPKEALEILSGVGFSEDLVVCSRLSYEDQRIVYGNLKDLIKFNYDFWGDPPHCLCIPSKLHFMEEKFLKGFRLK